MFVQAKAACVLIDLCSGALAPWMSHVVAKVGMGKILYNCYVVWFGSGLLVCTQFAFTFY